MVEETQPINTCRNRANRRFDLVDFKTTILEDQVGKGKDFICFILSGCGNENIVKVEENI